MLGDLDLIFRSMEATEELEAREEGRLYCALGRSLSLIGGEATRGKSSG